MKIRKIAGYILLAFIVSSCSQNETPAPQSELPGDKIVIRGSNTVGEELAPALMAAYKNENSKVQFDLESKGTSYGFGALVGGFCDIAGASRQPTPDEAEVVQSHNVELNDYTIGAYAVAVVVNEKNPVSNLTKEQVRDIFTGVITNWSVVGGPDAEIHLYIRDPISGTYLGFKELAMENKPYAADPKMLTTATNYDGILKSVAADANGIGYSGIYATPMAGAKSVSIDGIEANAVNVNGGKYPYARTLHLFTNKANERPVAMDFIKFVQSQKGQAVLAQLGNVPHS